MNAAQAVASCRAHTADRKAEHRLQRYQSGWLASAVHSGEAISIHCTDRTSADMLNAYLAPGNCVRTPRPRSPMSNASRLWKGSCGQDPRPLRTLLVHMMRKLCACMWKKAQMHDHAIALPGALRRAPPSLQWRARLRMGLRRPSSS